MPPDRLAGAQAPPKAVVDYRSMRSHALVATPPEDRLRLEDGRRGGLYNGDRIAGIQLFAWGPYTDRSEHRV